MKQRDMSVWVTLRESMWPVPLLLGAGGVGLAALTITLDAHFSAWIHHWIPFTFTGGAEAARVVLGTIAGAMATIVGIAFSISVVVLQLAAGQFSPRVITIFSRDRGQQIVLGTYLATFIYALLVVRQVEGGVDESQAFVPELSMLLALLLAMVCLGMLAYFVHHVSEQLRVSDVAWRVHKDLIDVGESIYPAGIREPLDEDREDEKLIEEIERSAGEPLIVRSEHSGYLRLIDVQMLVELTASPVKIVRVRPMVGQFVVARGPLVYLHLESKLSIGGIERSRCKPAIASPSALGRRSRRIRSSPSSSSSTSLCELCLPGLTTRRPPSKCSPNSATRSAGSPVAPFSSQVRRIDGRVLIAPRPSFAEHVAAAFDQDPAGSAPASARAPHHAEGLRADHRDGPAARTPDRTSRPSRGHRAQRDRGERARCRGAT